MFSYYAIFLLVGGHFLRPGYFFVLHNNAGLEIAPELGAFAIKDFAFATVLHLANKGIIFKSCVLLVTVA